MRLYIGRYSSCWFLDLLGLDLPLRKNFCRRVKEQFQPIEPWFYILVRSCYTWWKHLRKWGCLSGLIVARYRFIRKKSFPEIFSPQFPFSLPLVRTHDYISNISTHIIVHTFESSFLIMLTIIHLACWGRVKEADNSWNNCQLLRWCEEEWNIFGLCWTQGDVYHRVLVPRYERNLQWTHVVCVHHNCDG